MLTLDVSLPKKNIRRQRGACRPRAMAALAASMHYRCNTDRRPQTHANLPPSCSLLLRLLVRLELGGRVQHIEAHQAQGGGGGQDAQREDALQPVHVRLAQRAADLRGAGMQGMVRKRYTCRSHGWLCNPCQRSKLCPTTACAIGAAAARLGIQKRQRSTVVPGRTIGGETLPRSAGEAMARRCKLVKRLVSLNTGAAASGCNEASQRTV